MSCAERPPSVLEIKRQHVPPYLSLHLLTAMYHRGSTVPGQWKARKGRQVAADGCDGQQQAVF